MRFTVPARVGGVDLSTRKAERPILGDVPARVGGVDLSINEESPFSYRYVPARVGGVDLSKAGTMYKGMRPSPRSCGRGGFKPHYVVQRRVQHCLCHLGCNFDIFSDAIFI